MLTAVTGAQLAAARQADAYTTEVLSAQDVSTSARAAVRPEAFAGLASDGRPLASLLLRPVAAVELLRFAGVPIAKALATGLSALDRIVRTQVADAGRLADQVAAATRPAVQGHTRITMGVTCARCAILAGRWYRWSDGFARHPQCDCQMIPAREALADDLTTNPRRMIKAGLVHGLSKAERDAIAEGADPAQVVNTNQGVYLAGGRRFTRESTTRRGSSPTTPRLTVDQIFIESDGDRAEALRLLRLHGYIR